MKYESTISTKGQITIPVSVRNQLNLQSQDRVRFEVRSGSLVLHPVRREDLLAVYDSVDTKGKETDINTIRQETQKNIGKRVAEEGM